MTRLSFLSHPSLTGKAAPAIIVDEQHAAEDVMSKFKAEAIDDPTPVLDIKRFILAGRAVFTVTDKLTGKHFTYRVNMNDQKTKKWDAATRTHKLPDKVWFVNLGIKYEDQIYMGIITLTDDGQPKQIRSTGGSKVSPKAESWQVWERLWAGTFNDDSDMMASLEFRHEGRCCVCGRPLTNPHSIDSGIGPDCAAGGM